jgi:hypothetical protein
MSRRRLSVLSVLAWPIFRIPGVGWRRHAIALVLAAAATTFATVKYGVLAPVQLSALTPDGHAALSLEHALALTLCGKLGLAGARFPQPSLFALGQSAPARPFSQIVVDEYGSISQYCEHARPTNLNNENTLLYIDALLLFLPGDDTLQSLATKMVAFRCGMLVVSLYLLAYWGLGILPLLLIGIVAGRVLAVTQATHVLSIYPTMTIVPLFVAATMSGFAAILLARSARRVLLWAIAFGAMIGIVYNLRTPYGWVATAQLLVVTAAALFLVRPKATGKGAKLGATLAGAAGGFLLVQATLIWPLQRAAPAGFNYAYHVIWHPIVLGLSNPPNPFAESRGIRWEDSVGEQLARQVDPTATYLGPTFEAALRRYYLGLWKDHPVEMIRLHHDKLMAIGKRTMLAFGDLFDWPRLGELALRVIRNGYVWLACIAALTAVMTLAHAFPALLAVGMALAASLFLLTVEQMLIYPPYLPMLYQGVVLVNFVALLAVVIALPFARLLRPAATAHPTGRTQTEPGAHGRRPTTVQL